MRNRTKHELSWLTAISDAGSTPAASTIFLVIAPAVSLVISNCFLDGCLYCVSAPLHFAMPPIMRRIDSIISSVPGKIYACAGSNMP
jgi:hypothetical protein